MNKSIKEKLEAVLTYIVGGAALLTIFVANSGVLSRFLKFPLPATDELLRYIFVWIIAICAAFLFKEDGFINITLLEEILKNKKQLIPYKVLKVCSCLLTLLFAAICLYYSTVICVNEWQSQKISPVMELPMVYVTLGMTIGCLLWVIFAVIKLVKLIRAKNFSDA